VHPDADGSTWVSGAVWRRWSPSRRLDYVFLVQPLGSPWLVVDAAHIDAPGGPHSDHRAVLVRLLPG
jgi:endonuclease/exonuclease/phosphatase family metal-dependent hydrolase